MKIRAEDAYMDSPQPEEAWLAMDNAKRIDLLMQTVTDQAPQIAKQLHITDTKDDGQVIVKLISELGPNERGMLLLDLEDVLKQKVDNGLTVWHEPLGDKNSLRKLRGIEVKS